MADTFAERILRIFADLGRVFSDGESAHLKSVLKRQLDDAFSRSQRSTVTVTYESKVAGALDYEVNTHCMTIDEAYDNWIATREPPLFGTEPDARVWDLAAETADPAEHRILDIGAGTGRNALALARRGHPVDVVELTEQFADQIRSEAGKESLAVRVIQQNVFEADAELGFDYSIILLSEVVPEFRTTNELRRLFELAAARLKLGGRLVFNIFLPKPGYVPDARARQFAQQAYSGFFTRPEVALAVASLPLEIQSDDSVYDYEKTNLPAGAWPPTSWYEGWITGCDVFGGRSGEAPIELRWLVYRKTATGPLPSEG